MKIYVNTTTEKFYIDRFKDTSAMCFMVSDDDFNALMNETKVINYAETSEEGLVLNDNTTIKEDVLHSYVQGGTLYVETISGNYSVGDVTSI